jgi:decaprenyl-phosphate phosphoribosyltransferase
MRRSRIKKNRGVPVPAPDFFSGLLVRSPVLVSQVSVVAACLFMQGVLIWKSMRPLDWIKNLFVFAPVFFAGEVNQTDKLLTVSLVFIAFNTMSSAVYMFNDIQDRERDSTHPTKCKRPIASGALSLEVAIFSACFLAACSILLMRFSPPAIGILLIYGGINLLYSWWLKHVVILDVFSIALGFVLRVFAGGVIIGVQPSSWLIMATFLLSLVLALGKRRHEVLAMKDTAKAHRPVLEQYTTDLIDQLISVVTPVTLVTYVLYTLDPETIARFHSPHLYLTGIFTVFGIFRYLYLVNRSDLGGSPTLLVVKDAPLRSAVLGWIFYFILIVYIA